jgi:hypothetical protein
VTTDPSSGPHSEPTAAPSGPPPGATPPATPEEPVFAAPTPPGALPAEGLTDLHLPDLPQHGPASAGGAPGTTSPRRTVSARARRRLLWAGTAVAVLAVAGGVTGIAVTTARDRAWEPLPAAVPEPVEANAVQLVLGTCLRGLPAGDVGRVAAVPCDDAHVAQVVGRTDSDPGAVWPGGDALVQRASTVCGPEQLGSAGREVDGVRFVVLTPSEEGWSRGDRTGLCLAVTDEPGAHDLLS